MCTPVAGQPCSRLCPSSVFYLLTATKITLMVTTVKEREVGLQLQQVSHTHTHTHTHTQAHLPSNRQRVHISGQFLRKVEWIHTRTFSVVGCVLHSVQLRPEMMLMPLLTFDLGLYDNLQIQSTTKHDGTNWEPRTSDSWLQIDSTIGTKFHFQHFHYINSIGLLCNWRSRVVKELNKSRDHGWLEPAFTFMNKSDGWMHFHLLLFSQQCITYQ